MTTTDLALLITGLVLAGIVELAIIRADRRRDPQLVSVLTHCRRMDALAKASQAAAHGSRPLRSVPVSNGPDNGPSIAA